MISSFDDSLQESYSLNEVNLSASTIETLDPEVAAAIREQLRPLREKLASPEGQQEVRRELDAALAPAIRAERRHLSRSKALAHTKVVV